MTKSNDEWVPEVGTECEYQLGCGHWFKCKIKAVCEKQGAIIYCDAAEYGEQYVSFFGNQAVTFREIKTEAEKRRDEQIEDLALTLISNSRGSVRDSALARTLAVAVIDSGYIKPKRLTDQDIDLLLKNHWYVLGVTNRDFALAVELYVRGELGL